jgi:hypothetical protein
VDDWHLKRMLSNANFFENVLIMPDTPQVDREWLNKVKRQLDRREEEIYAVVDKKIVWMNLSAKEATPTALHSHWRIFCTKINRLHDCDQCHQLSSPYITINYGRTKMFFPFFVEQAVRGFILLISKGSRNHGNYAGPMLIAPSDKAGVDP